MAVKPFFKVPGNMAYLQTDGLMLLCVGVMLSITLLYLLYSKKRKLPPGPMGLPILGCYPYLRKDRLKTMSEMSQKYGSVFGFYLGPQYLAIMNDWDAMTDAFSQTSALDRPPGVFDIVPYNFGFGGLNGPVWLQTRRVASKVMKDIGLHHTRWEELVKEEASEIVERIVKYGDGPLDITQFLADSFCNNVMTLVLGKRLPVGHPLTRTVTKSVDAIIESTPVLDMMNYSPTLMKILELLGLENGHQIEECVMEFTKVVSNTVDKKICNSDNETEDSFIDSYCQEMKNNRNKPNNYLTEDNLKGNVVVLLAGGTETSRTTTVWTLIAMADHPEKQQKVHEELDRVVGRDGSVRWADRMKIPYTYATLLESMRWKTVVPFTTLRKTSADMEIRGYHIPKGSFTFGNTWMMHNDPKYWKEPEKFIPERFLLEDGKKVNSSPDSYNPFSYGKRNCPGKLIALMEILVFFCYIMQKFKVVPADGKKVKHGASLGLTYQATDVQLRFIPRDNE